MRAPYTADATLPARFSFLHDVHNVFNKWMYAAISANSSEAAVMHDPTVLSLTTALQQETSLLFPRNRPRLLAFGLTLATIHAITSVPLVSVDTGSNGSSSRGSDGAITKLASDNIMARLNHLDAKGDEFESPGTVG